MPKKSLLTYCAIDDKSNFEPVGTPLEIPTAESNNIQQPPQWMLPRPTASRNESRESNAPRPRPTYSKARNAYEDLVDIYYHQQCVATNNVSPGSSTAVQMKYWKTEGQIIF